MNDDGRVEVKFDPYIGTLSVVLDGSQNRQLTIDNLPPETAFFLVGETDADQRPLWVSHEEADVLVKMITYIIDKVKVSESSKDALAGLLPRVEQVRDESTAG